jgi:recombination DNA repair RAD52 pathway protein
LNNVLEEIETPFTPVQLQMLRDPLNPTLISERQGGGGAMLKHIEGHNAIDQANNIFGFGNWNYRPLSVEQVILRDPLTGEGLGVMYQATVELTVKGCAPIVDVGCQPVAIACVEDWLANFYSNQKRYNKPVDESEEANRERLKKARTAIVEAHEMAWKGSVTDALKRAMRAYGRQFGNDLYGKPKPQKALSIGQVKNAARVAGRASDPESWKQFVTDTLGEYTETFTQEHLQKLMSAAA